VKAPQRRAPTVLGYVGTYPSLPHPHSENASTTQYKLHDKKFHDFILEFSVGR
jgi:hypothetical protein